MDIHYGYLRGIAKEIGKSEELVSDENMEMLISLEEETALERTALIEADGTVIMITEQRRMYLRGDILRKEWREKKH